jgi:hypothetical protein
MIAERAEIAGLFHAGIAERAEMNCSFLCTFAISA